jgi:multidrug efflux pump subunit AcrA (membrane-fusion protein)
VLVLIAVSALAAFLAARARSPVEPLIHARGYISVAAVPVGAPFAGSVRTITVRGGEQVHKGQVLAVMDTSDIEAQMTSAQLRADTARAAYVAAAATIQEREEATELHEAALAETLWLARFVENAYVKAPWSGRVRAVTADPGAALPSGTAIVELEDTANVTMTFSAPSSARAYITDGTEMRIILATPPARPIVAHVVRVSVANHRIDVEATLDDSVLVADGSAAIAFIKTAPSAEWPQKLESTK